MPIPTQADYDLSEIGQLADGIETKLRVIRHSKGGSVFQARTNRESLREQLQEFVNACMAFANGVET